MPIRANLEAFARCAAAARRADLPAATLRVWERRYGVVGPQRSAAGQRLYSEADVQRLKTLKRVVDRGYAIGTVARLSTDQLQLLAMATDPTASEDQDRPLLKWAVVGGMLAERLASLAFVTRNEKRYADVPAAMSSLAPDAVDIIILHSPSLREEACREILELASRHPSTRIAVVYSFSVATAVSKLHDAQIRLLRDPLNRMQMLQALGDLARSVVRDADRARSTQPARVARRFDDKTLLLIEQRATAIACECPSHLTALISQLSAFETYSDECVSPNSREEILHRHIGDVASQARSLLESLLQRVASDEGLSI